MSIITGFISGGLGNVAKGKCFVAGTAILTASGFVAIENIRAGDWVPATDPETGETALKQVVQTFVRESDELIHIHVNGEEIITTPTHPFWVPQKGWTDVVLLRAGDYLQLLNGEYVVIERIQHELLEVPVTVYNFEVEDFHTYFVTQSSILVHNANCGFDNKVISQTTDKKYGSMRIDLERGGSGKYNLHLHQGNNKFMFNGTDGFIGAGKINKTEFVQAGIKKAFKYMKKIGVKSW